MPLDRGFRRACRRDRDAQVISSWPVTEIRQLRITGAPPVSGLPGDASLYEGHSEFQVRLWLSRRLGIP